MAKLPDTPPFVLGIALFWIKEITTAIEQPVILVEAAPVRVSRLAGAEMQLAAERRQVAGSLQSLDQRDQV